VIIFTTWPLYTPRQKPISTHLIGGWLGPRTGLCLFEVEKVLLPLSEIETRIVHSKIPPRFGSFDLLESWRYSLVVCDAVWPGRHRRFRGNCCSLQPVKMEAAAVISIDSSSLYDGRFCWVFIATCLLG
jgi:hypothetical protein